MRIFVFGSCVFCENGKRVRRTGGRTGKGYGGRTDGQVIRTDARTGGRESGSARAKASHIIMPVAPWS